MASDHEQVSDISWFLDSSRYQKDQWIAEMFSKELRITVGARWRQIRTSDSSKHNQNNSVTDNVMVLK
jgi:hypothetical protein